MDIRLLKIIQYDQPMIYITGLIMMDGNADGSVAVKLGGAATAVNSKPFVQLDEWMQVTFISRAAATVTEMYVNGLYLCDIAQITNLPTAPVAWYGAHNYVAIKSLKIWTEALPLSFIS